MVSHQPNFTYKLEAYKLDNGYVIKLWCNNELLEKTTVSSLDEVRTIVADWVPDPRLIKLPSFSRSARQHYNIISKKNENLKIENIL